MSVRRIKAGTTDVSVTLRIVDSTDGTPETGVVFNTAGIDLWYRRDGAASVDITEATLSALTDAHSDGGFLHINDGSYRLDLPDAACATGVPGVQIGGTVTGMVVFGPYIELPVFVEEDIEALVDDIGVAGAGLTAIPWNAAWDAEVQSEATDALNAYDPPTRAELTSDISGLDAKLDAIDNFLDTEIAAILEDTGTTLDDFLDTEVAAILADTNELQTDWANGGRLDLLIDAIKAKTDSLTFTVAGLLDTNPLRINGVAAAAANLQALMTVGGVRVAVNGVASTTAIPIDGFTSTRNDQFNGRLVTVLDGTFEQTDITDYVHATQTLTVTALTAAPADNVELIIT